MIDDFSYPATKEFRIALIDDIFSVLPGEFNLQTFIRTKKKPDLGKHTLKLIIEFQACNQQACMLAEKLEFSLPITVSRSLE